MTRVVRTIGDSSESGTIFRWQPDVAEFNDLSSQSGSARYLHDFQYIDSSRQSGTSNYRNFLMYFGSTVSTSRGVQELTEKWEKFESAIVIRAGNLSLYIPGPDYSGNIRRDQNEHYIWRPPSSMETYFDSFITAYYALSQSDRDNTTMELRDSYINLTKGDTSYNKVYVGNTEQKKIYKGNTLIHDLRSNG